MQPGRRETPLRLDAFGRPFCPSAAEWRALTPAQQEALSEQIRLALVGWRDAQPPQGTPHERAIRRTLDRVERHYDRKRRGLFLAADLPVEYPEAAAFAPDLLAVHDAGTHDRQSWNVVNEGRGLDFVLEVHFKGDSKKDLKENVEFYASLGIPEYFIYDGAQRRIIGWQLADSGEHYVQVMPQYGRYPSRVLGLEFAVVDDALRLFQDGAEILNAREEIVALVAAVNDRESALAEQAARADAEAARAEAEATRAEAEATRAEAEATRAEAEAARADAGLDATRALLLVILHTRGFSLTDAQNARVATCRSSEQLLRWGVFALTATSVDQALQD